MAPGTLQTILCLNPMFRSLAVRRFESEGCGMIGFSITIPGPQSNVYCTVKKNRKSSLSYAAFWGTFAPTLFHEACRLVEVPQHWNQPVAAAIAATNVGSRGLRNRSIWFRQEIDWI